MSKQFVVHLDERVPFATFQMYVERLRALEMRKVPLLSVVYWLRCGPVQVLGCTDRNFPSIVAVHWSGIGFLAMNIQ